jgi:hypothetical protein
MSAPIEKALAYLDALEADRRAAVALCEQKAEEARLIKARQEGFQAAMEMLGWPLPAGGAVPDRKRSVQRRARRDTPQIILRELSFSGETLTTTQIAKAIEYLPEPTEAALKRMEETGQVFRNEEGRWGVALTGAQPNLRAVTTVNNVSPPSSVLDRGTATEPSKRRAAAGP